MLTTSLNPGLPSWAVIAVLTAGLSLGSFGLSGLYCTHQDISPKYASVLSVRAGPDSASSAGAADSPASLFVPSVVSPRNQSRSLPPIERGTQRLLPVLAAARLTARYRPLLVPPASALQPWP
jgi:hypothetical protein